jgi:site-specific recombinase XerD
VTGLAPVVTGTIVARPHSPSVRDVVPGEWDQDAAWNAAVGIWLKSKTSQHSRDAYRRDITLWHDWCDENDVPLNDARRADVDDWRDHLNGKPATVARRLSAVSSFYAYWLSEDMVARNPAARAARPKVSSAPVSIFLTRRQSADLLAYVDGMAGKRPGVIVRLLAQTGMRVGELTAARIPDLGMSGGHHTLTIVRKGGEPAELVVAGSTYERVISYLGGRRDGYILHVQRTERRTGDGQMDRSHVRQLLRRVAREAGLPEAVHAKMHPHVLRHSAATILAADNIPLHEIQALLGHADLRTTQRYIHHQKDLDNSPVYVLARLLSS